ncbi:MAG: hypothetical protein HYY17_07100 [Planctomycetes bacterium]|nr:hypothetical protein [Planctomycetota bacterium]
MKRRIGILAAAGLAAVLSACSPKLDSPEAVADEYAKLRIKERGMKRERDLLRNEEEIELAERQVDLWSGRGAITQRLDVEKECLDFTRDNLSAIKDDVVVDIVDIRDLDAGRKRVTLKFWTYAVKTPEAQRGDKGGGRVNPKAFYLDYAPSTEWIDVVKIGGEWKILAAGRERD